MRSPLSADDMEDELQCAGTVYLDSEGTPYTRFSEDRIRDFATQMLMGLYHLHTKSIVHGHVKLPNPLIFTGENGDTIKLADFGSSRMVTSTERIEAKFRGTIDYMAPEMLECLFRRSTTARFNYSVSTANLLRNVSPFLSMLE